MGETQRIDKWLWHARVARTRTLAACLVTGGHIRINRQRISKASHAVRRGDVVTVGLPSRVLVLRVEAIVERRGPAASARLTYEDLSPEVPPRQNDAFRPPGSGRPTKQDRRALDMLKRHVPMSDDLEK